MTELRARWTDAARSGRRVGHAIEAHARIGSTNDRAHDLLVDPDADGLVVVADEQTAGRGRRGREWYTPAGRSLSMSAVLHPRLTAPRAWQLSLATALAAARAIDPIAPVELKWPNDLLGGGERKLGGILIETVLDGDRLTGAVIGIGINVDWRRAEVPDHLRQRAVSLTELAGSDVDPVGLLERLLDALSDEVEAMEAGRSPLERYRARCSTLGLEVTMSAGTERLTGRAVGLDASGALLVETADGRRHAVASGEVVA